MSSQDAPDAPTSSDLLGAEGPCWNRRTVPLLSAVAAYAATGAALLAFDHYSLARGDAAEAHSRELREALTEFHGQRSASGAASDSVVTEPDHTEVKVALDGARSLRRMFLDGQHQWLDTLVHLDDPAFVSDRRLECSSRLGQSISTCLYRVAMVIRPDGDKLGTIVHAQSNIVDPHDSPGLAEDNDRECEAFVSCIAASRVGERIPIPVDEVRVFALEQLYQSNQAHPTLFSVEKVDKTIDAFGDEVRRLEHLTDRSPHDEWQLRKLQNLTRYLRQHLRKLEEVEAHASHSPE